MASLIQSVQHEMDLLALFTDVDGVLTDAYQVQFEVWDISSSIPGTQLLPSGGGKATVTTGNGHVSTGTYGVIDPATDAAWIPGAAYAKVRVVWYYKIASTDTEQIVEKEFEVLASTVATQPNQNIALIQDVKDAGWTGTDDKAIFRALHQRTELVERYCRQRFSLKRQTRRFRGTGGMTLFLPEPVRMAYGYVNSQTSLVDLTTVRVYGTTEHERRSPKIEIKSENFTDIYANAFFDARFENGTEHKLTGLWGYVDDRSLEAPELLRDATAKGTKLALQAATATSATSGPIRMEMTDGHMITYATSNLRSAMLDIIRASELRDVLDLYRAPIALAAPGTPRYK